MTVNKMLLHSTMQQGNTIHYKTIQFNTITKCAHLYYVVLFFNQRNGTYIAYMSFKSGNEIYTHELWDMTFNLYIIY